jgi:Xaa-Pro aminopeptidase
MKTARLIVADSERDADMLYAVGMFVPDPFIYFEIAGRTYAVLSDLEVDRARKQATVDRVLSLSRYQKALKKTGMVAPRLSDVVNRVLREFRVRAVEVPCTFSLGLAQRLRGIRVKVKPGPFFTNREIKTAAEVAKIGDALSLAEHGMRSAVNVLRASRIGPDGFLRWHGTKLTAEHVQGMINATIAGLGGTANHTIVACGNQGCDPHETGHGPLKAHKPIILDIFPRDAETGYWGDITRTVVRGRASEQIRVLYATVSKGQEIAFEKLRDGVNSQDVHQAVHASFRKAGFVTGRRAGRMQGFFHGTGHGLGLEIHEQPRVSSMEVALRAGHVVTVEPGLYYWGIGGVRLEDVALIQAKRARNLTQFPKVLEI